VAVPTAAAAAVGKRGEVAMEAGRLEATVLTGSVMVGGRKGEKPGV